jgi:hypothetical protein
MRAAQQAHRGTPVADTPEPRHGAFEHPTPQSIAAARDAQRREREAFFKATGLRVDRGGRPIFPPRLVHR